MKRLPWLLIPLLLASCTSLSKKAREYFEAGDYEESVRTYDQALQKDPGDAAAIAGRAEAREKLIDVTLLRVRQSRLAGNAQNAIDMLLDLVERENAWGFAPKNGAVASTQDEESAEAFRYVQSEVRTALPSHHPLRAEFLLNHYRAIFQGPWQAPADGLRKLARGARENACRRFVAASPAPGAYYLEFLEKVCAGRGALPKQMAQVTHRKFDELYRGVKVTAKLEGFPEGYAAVLEDDLRQGLIKTPWFDARGAKMLTVTLSGRFAVEQTEKPEERLHNYWVSIPYTAYEEQPRSREVPYFSTETQCSPGASGTPTCIDVPVTRYRTENYTETVPVTRYREEPRVQAYTGRERTQTLTVFVNADAAFASVRRQFGVNEKAQDRGFEHDVSMPSIGLYPSQANLRDPQTWLKEQTGKLTGFIEDSGNSTWENLYCRPLAKHLSVAETGEQVHRCLRRQLPEVPKFVEDWYQRNLGISVAEADELFGTRDL